MNRPRLAPTLATAAVVAAAALLPGSPVTRDAHAATGIQRCEAADGSVVYTDKPCAAFDARATPMSGELLTRVARIQREETARARGSYADAATFLPAAATAPAAVAGRRSVAGGCASSPTQLAMDLRGAFALGDVNRIAESYHWAGMGHEQAAQVMARLEGLGTQPLADTQYFDATISIGGYAEAGAEATPAKGGIMQLMFGDGGVSSVVDMDVEHYQGCYFVRF